MEENIRTSDLTDRISAYSNEEHYYMAQKVINTKFYLRLSVIYGFLIVIGAVASITSAIILTLQMNEDSWDSILEYLIVLLYSQAVFYVFILVFRFHFNKLNFYLMIFISSANILCFIYADFELLHYLLDYYSGTLPPGLQDIFSFFGPGLFVGVIFYMVFLGGMTVIGVRMYVAYKKMHKRIYQ